MSAAAIVLSGAAGAALLWGIYLGYSEIDVWGVFLVPVVLCTITIPFIRRMESTRTDGLADLFTVALVAKMVGAYVRYLVMYHVYEGNDSAQYHLVGVRIADEYLRGDRSVLSLFPTATSTKFVEQLNGLVAVLSGRSLLASFMVFSWFSFIGLVCFVTAARRAVPGLMVRRYAVLTLFLPSVLFWSSSLGKDAWMVFGMGLFAVGAARLYTGSISGVVFLLVGAYATAVVRPHLTAIALAALAVGFVGRRMVGRRSVSAATVMLGLLGVALMAAVTAPILDEVLPRSSEGLTGILTATEGRTSIGGSEIEISAPNSPLEYPAAFFTVLFRPVLLEVRSATQFVSAVEGTILIGLIALWRRNIGDAVRATARVPYLRFAGIYTLAFAFAWSSIGNLGIIVRQRVQVLPLLLLFLCVANAPQLRGGER
jgi:hypothetical protein